jgi:hypothetical protein
LEEQTVTYIKDPRKYLQECKKDWWEKTVP